MTELVKYIRYCTALAIFIMSGQILCLESRPLSPEPHSACALLTDQNYYFAGSTLWFSMVHPLDFQENGSTIRYAQWVLADETNKPVASHRIEVDGNLTHGSYRLPGKLESGCYRLIVMIAIPEKGNMYYCQKWISVVNISQATKVHQSGSMENTEADSLFPTGHDSAAGQQGHRATLEVYPEAVPLRSRAELVITLKDSADNPLFGEFTVCVSKKPCTDASGYSVKPGIAPSSTSDACGIIGISRIPEGNITTISMIRNEEEYTLTQAGWLYPEDSLFTGEIIVGIPGENGYFVRQPMQHNRFLIVQLPRDIQKDTLVIKLEQDGKEVNFVYENFTCIKYMARLPVPDNPFDPENGPVWNHPVENSLVQIIHAYEKWGIDLLDQSSQSTRSVRTSSGPFYGTPDVRIRPDEYGTSEDMENFIRDFVPQIRFRDKKQSTTLSFTPMYKTDLVKSGDPQVLVNAVPVTDAGLVKKLPVAVIDRMDIMLQPAVYEGNYFNGLVAITLKDDIALKDYLPPEIRLIQIDKVQQPAIIHAQKETSLPDLRTTLCWETGILPDETGKIKTSLNTSDIAGSFVVRIFGITEKGCLIYEEGTVTIN